MGLELDTKKPTEATLELSDDMQVVTSSSKDSHEDPEAPPALVVDWTPEEEAKAKRKYVKSCPLNDPAPSFPIFQQLSDTN